MKTLRSLFVLVLALSPAIAGTRPHDFTTGSGTSPGAPGNPNNGQPPTHHGSANDPDAWGDSDPVDLFRGELIYDRRDAHVPGRGPGVDLTFHYRSQSVVNGQFGYGWTFTYGKRVKKLDNGNAVHLNGLNHRYEYTAVGDGTYTSPAGIVNRLIENVDGTFTLRYLHGDVETYGIHGALEHIEDASGNALTFTYDPAGLLPVIAPSAYFVGIPRAVVALDYRLTRITDTIGNHFDFAYNADGQLESISFLGRTITYAYSAAGDLASVTLPATQQFPQGRTTNYTYVAHNLTEVRDAKGQLTLTTVYNPTTDRVTSQTFEGGTASYAFSTTGGVSKATVTDRKGFVTEYTFNAGGQVIQSKRLTDGVPSGEPASYITTHQYDAAGRLVRTVHPRGNAVELTRDANGNVTEVRQKKIGVAAWTPHADDIVESFTYEPLFHHVATATDPLGRTTTFVYDHQLSESPRGLLRKVILPAVGGTNPEIEHTYDAHGQLVETIDPTGRVTRFDRYAATGYVERVTAGHGTAAATSTEYEYDAFANVTLVRDGLGRETTFEYDAHDHVVRTIAPAPFAYETRLRYDANDQVVQIDRELTGGTLPAPGTTDPLDGWETTLFVYDAFGRVTTTVDDLGQSTTFTYDSNGNVATTTDANGRVTTFQYDERDLPWRAIDSQTPSGTTETRYDPNGNLVYVQSPAGHVTSHTYDDFDRGRRTTWVGGAFEEASYDKASNVTSLLTANGSTITYVHDALDRVTSVVRSSGTDTFVYDLAGRVLEAANAEAVVTYQYDGAGRVTHETTTFPGSSQGHTVQYRYDAASRVDRITYPDGSSIDVALDALDRVTTLASNSTTLVTYGYDALGRRTSISRANGVVTSHVFDAVGELVGITHSGPLGTIDARTYVYDAIGRRTSETGPEGTHVFAYDSLSQLTATTRPSGYPHPSTTFTYDASGNRLTAGAVTYVPNALDQYATVGGVTQTHDDAGNLTSDGANAYTYDAENRLIAASGPGGNATYGYDALGRRVRKSVGASTIRYVHDGEQIIQELDASGAVQATWRYGIGLDEPLTIERAGQTHWYLADPIGSIRALTDAFGAIAESYLYDAFGAAAIFDGTGTPLAGSALGNPYLFTGRQIDPETGLFHYRARAYSPTTGRFLQRDPLGQAPDVNVYRYCRNSPLDTVDPLGLMAQDGWTRVALWLDDSPYRRWIIDPDFVNFAAGMGDVPGRLLCLWQANPTAALRRAVGAKQAVNESSGAYANGCTTGLFAAAYAVAWWGAPIVDALAASAMLRGGVAAGTAGAAGSAAANLPRAAHSYIDPNKLRHIFDNAAHNLGGLVARFGSQEAAYTALQRAAQSASAAGRLGQIRPGVFQGTVNVGGMDIVVRGAVVDGIFRLGSAWR